MRARSAWVCMFTLAAVFVAGAQPYIWIDSGSVPEPWSGWWWPVYDGGPDGGPYLWQGGGGKYGDDPGSIYDLDTRYLWTSAVSPLTVVSAALDSVLPKPRIWPGVTVFETLPTGAPGILHRCASPAQTGGTL